jgi:hypothetical protein
MKVSQVLASHPDAALARGLTRQDARIRRKLGETFGARYREFLQVTCGLARGKRLSPAEVDAAIARAEAIAVSLSPLALKRFEASGTSGRPKAATAALVFHVFVPTVGGGQRIVVVQFSVERRRWNFDCYEMPLIIVEHAFARALQRAHLSAAAFGAATVSALPLLPRMALPVAGGLLLGDVDKDIGSKGFRFGFNQGRVFNESYENPTPVLIAKTFVGHDALSPEQERQVATLTAEVGSAADIDYPNRIETEPGNKSLRLAERAERELRGHP